MKQTRLELENESITIACADERSKIAINKKGVEIIADKITLNGEEQHAESNK